MDFRSTRVVLSLVALVAMIVISPRAHGGELVLAPSDAGVITNPEHPGDVRLLVRFGLPDALSNGVVELAVLEFSAEIASPDSGGVQLDAFLVTTSWEGGSVDWSEGWQTPGGDVDASFHAASVARAGGEAMVRFDVTGMVGAWATGVVGNHGLLVARAPGETGTMQPTCPGRPQSGFLRLRLWVTPQRDE